MRLIAFTPKSPAKSPAQYSHPKINSSLGKPSKSLKDTAKLGILLADDASDNNKAFHPHPQTKIIDLGLHLQSEKSSYQGICSIKHLLQAFSSEEAGLDSLSLLRRLEKYQNKPADYTLADIRFLPSVHNAEKYICIGVNYQHRNEEYKDGSPPPQKPSVFMRSRESFVGHLEALRLPKESPQLDYEGEIAIVISREGRRIPANKAPAYIAGLSLMNEGSVRDWMRHGKFNVTQGKNFTASGSLGPWLHVKNFEYDKLSLSTKVNDELRQKANTSQLRFSFSYLIAYLSTFFTLRPGDVIATGTPTGSGVTFKPARFLKAADTISVESKEIGYLENPVAEE